MPEVDCAHCGGTVVVDDASLVAFTEPVCEACDPSVPRDRVSERAGDALLDSL